jgi:undecaprenyl diphosphate synthase
MPSDIPKVPVHVGFIMDGNRRWARANGIDYEQAYHKGMSVLEVLVERAAKCGVKFITAYTFSTENWTRPKIEVDLLMRLFEFYLAERVHKLHEKNVRLRVIGRIEEFSKNIQNKLHEHVELTKDNTAITLTLALNYGGHAEIVDAAKQLILSGTKDINAETLRSATYDPSQPPVDLIIRTSGEKRTSGFMLWHADYAELCFLEKNWPELTAVDLDAALEDYAQRKRNFGA